MFWIKPVRFLHGNFLHFWRLPQYSVRACWFPLRPPAPGGLAFPGFPGFLGASQKFIHFVFNFANLMKLVKVAPSEKRFVIILSVENTSQRSCTDVIKVVYAAHLQDRRLRDCAGGQVHAQALEVNKLVKILGGGRIWFIIFSFSFSFSFFFFLFVIVWVVRVFKPSEGCSGINIPLRDPLINLEVVCDNGMSSLSTYSTFVSWHEPDKWRKVLVAEASVVCWVYWLTAVVSSSGCTSKSCLLTQECRLGTLWGLG